MNFFKDAGKLAIGTRIRFLADRFTQDTAKIYQTYETDIQPKWFPVFYTLSKQKQNSVTSIAEYIGHSHASVSKIIGEMSNLGLINEKQDSKDKRRTKIQLSLKGVNAAKKLEQQYKDVTGTIEDILKQTTHDLWAALEEWEQLLNQKPLKVRVLEKKTQREPTKVKIISYKPEYQEAFFKLNEAWIKTYFKMEKLDRDYLKNPQSHIIDKGGFIFVAIINKEPVGVCALIKRDDLICYELAKMAVSPKMQGKNIGRMLGDVAIKKAASLGANRLFLESNTMLKPAIGLYKKLGFKKIIGPPTPYERCNIQMELNLRKLN